MTRDASALGVDPRDLRNLTNTVFRYRRKMPGPRVRQVTRTPPGHGVRGELPETS